MHPKNIFFQKYILKEKLRVLRVTPLVISGLVGLIRDFTKSVEKSYGFSTLAFFGIKILAILKRFWLGKSVCKLKGLQTFFVFFGDMKLFPRSSFFNQFGFFMFELKKKLFSSFKCTPHATFCYCITIAIFTIRVPFHIQDTSLSLTLGRGADLGRSRLTF